MTTIISKFLPRHRMKLDVYVLIARTCLLSGHDIGGPHLNPPRCVLSGSIFADHQLTVKL